MASVNKVILVGNLGADPELRYTQSQEPVATLSVATNKKWKDKSGNPQEKTEWHRVVVWGKQAENCSKYLTKGRPVYLEGELETRKWQDKDGKDRWTTEIRAYQVQFLGSGEGGGPTRPPHPGDQQQVNGATPPPGQSMGEPSTPGLADIPF